MPVRLVVVLLAVVTLHCLVQFLLRGFLWLLHVLAGWLLLGGAVLLTVGVLLMFKSPPGRTGSVVKVGLAQAASGAALIAAAMVLDRAAQRRARAATRGFEVQTPSPNERPPTA